jgi:hypothetical protein
MSQMKTVQLLHPRLDGADHQEKFLQLLAEAIRKVPPEGKMVELRSVQTALLSMGWHP